MTDKRPTLTIKPKSGSAAKPAPKKVGNPAARFAQPAAQAAAKPGAKPAGPKPAREAEQGRAQPRHQQQHQQPQQARRAQPPREQPQDRLKPSYEVKQHFQPDYVPDLPPDSLALALLGASNAIAQVGAGTALPQALAHVFTVFGVTPQARGAIQDLAYRSMRQMGRSETLLGLMTSKEPDAPQLAGLLCCALALLDPAEGEAPYEAFTVVDQAVTAAASHPDFAHAKAMVNAVLRRFLREREQLVKQALAEPIAQWNYPQWWIDATRAAYPKDWEAILAAGNTHPPLTLRVNIRKTSLADYLRRLEEAGMAAEQVGPQALRLKQAVNVAQIPGFHDGLVSVQDAGAQLAGPLLGLQDGMRVLDACAAPGGKSGHILELANVELTSVDADPQRLKRVADNIKRLDLDATLVAAEAQARDWWDGRQYDRILADVPCTASGIVRRHPDIRWLRRKTDTRQLTTLSAEILDNLWQMLRPDGKLLFVTCSLWPQESEAQAAAFAARHNDATRLDAPGQLLPVSGAGLDHDGLFYALFHKKGA